MDYQRDLDWATAAGKDEWTRAFRRSNRLMEVAEEAALDSEQFGLPGLQWVEVPLGSYPKPSTNIHTPDSSKACSVPNRSSPRMSTAGSLSRMDS